MSIICRRHALCGPAYARRAGPGDAGRPAVAAHRLHGAAALPADAGLLDDRPGRAAGLADHQHDAK